MPRSPEPNAPQSSDLVETNIAYLAYASGVAEPSPPAAASATVVHIAPTGDPEIDGVLSGFAWSGTVTYSFPDSPSDYPTGFFYFEPNSPSFTSISVQQQGVADTAVALVESYTNLNIEFAGTDLADIMLAQSSAANPTAYAYYPADARGGDVWFGNSFDYRSPTMGDYSYLTVLHELGHAFGLKHSHEAGGPGNTPVPFEHDALEYSIMSYRSYPGGSTEGAFTNGDFGFPQTYMANDILGLQTMYGANYSTNSGNTHYSWDPATGQMFIDGTPQGLPGSGQPGANVLFLTIWDGGGDDTYDMSNYIGPTVIDLNPGHYSITSQQQLADLGDGVFAHGNVYNAYLFEDDTRSYIENAVGGSDNDSITGNAVANVLYGGAGDDAIFGDLQNDLLFGGDGNDFLAGGNDNDVLDGGPAKDHLSGGPGADTFEFEPGFGADKVRDFASGTDKLDLSALATDFAHIVLVTHDQGIVVLTHEGAIVVPHAASLQASDFVF